VRTRDMKLVHEVAFGRQILRPGDVGHLDLVMKPFFGELERCGHREDGLAMLDRDHTPCREAATVADPSHHR